MILWLKRLFKKHRIYHLVCINGTPVYIASTDEKAWEYARQFRYGELQKALAAARTSGQPFDKKQIQDEVYENLLVEIFPHEIDTRLEY